MFYKKGVLRNFAKFTGKHLCQRLFFNKVAGVELQVNRTNYVRYLGIEVDENLNWIIYIHDLASELNRASSVLSKLRHFVSSEILIFHYLIFHILI